MTDKQIIIDGVDVSKCIYFQQEDGEYTCGAEECNGAIVACRACDNCYYKQLKRSEAQCEAMFVSHTDLEKKYKAKEQECEELKNELIDVKWKIEAQDIELNDNVEQLDQLKAENDELKEEKQGLIKDWEEKKNLAYEVACKNEKLKQTLTEIKFWARELLKRTGQVVPYEIKQILQKISEVEDEHNG